MGLGSYNDGSGGTITTGASMNSQANRNYNAQSSNFTMS